MSRLLDMGAPGYLIATALQACSRSGWCAASATTARSRRSRRRRRPRGCRAFAGDNARAGSYKTGAGCNHCNKTGYVGRIGVYELLEMDADLADALRTGDAQVFAARTHSTSYRPLDACGPRPGAAGPHEPDRSAARVGPHFNDVA